MVFSEVNQGSVPGTPIQFKRIMISTKNPDGSIGDLIFPTEELFSFGVSENTDPGTGKVNGYTLPLCMWSRDGATKSQKAWTDTFDNVIEKVKDHIVENREEIEQYDLSKNDLKKLNPMYYKREKGKIVEGTGPTLYAKLIVSKKQNKIISMFYDYNGDSIDPLTLCGKYCFARAAIKIESIFIGNKISLQVKLYEVEVRLAETGMKRLLSRPKAQTRVLTSKVNNPLNESESNEEGDGDEEEVGSIGGSDNEEEGEQVPEEEETSSKKGTKKKVVRRVRKVMKKKD
jgi:hypothetical protein